MPTIIGPQIEYHYPAREELDPLDADALDRCIALARKESESRDQQITNMLADRSWFEVARFCSGMCQGRALGLEPHESEPESYPRGEAHLSEPTPGRQIKNDDPRKIAACRLAQRMLDAGLSVFEPDPPRALAAKARV